MKPYVRRHPRQPLAAPAVLIVAGERRKATLVDLSRGGAGLHSIDECSGLSTSEPVRIRIDLPLGGPLEVRGRLVRVHFNSGARYGVSFQHLPQTIRRRIEALTLPACPADNQDTISRSRTLLSHMRRLSHEIQELSKTSQRIRDDGRRARSTQGTGLLTEDLSDRREALAAVVHELRRPITTVLGWAGLLREGKLGPEKADRALQSIEEAARALDRRTGDLFDLSRLMLGRLPLDRRPVDARALVRQTARGAELSARDKRLRLRVRLGRPARPLLADPDRLAQAIDNLLSNAIKFTPEGGRIGLSLIDERGRACRIEVSDTGIGIAPRLQGLLFRPFMRGHSGYPGLGLGLSLARSVCELHGGRLEASSGGEGRGATFTIRLPYAPPDA